MGVSFIYFNPDGELCSIGRDGFIRYWNVVENGIELVASDKLPIKWPTRVIHSKSYGLLVIGFSEVNFFEKTTLINQLSAISYLPNTPINKSMRKRNHKTKHNTMGHSKQCVIE